MINGNVYWKTKIISVILTSCAAYNNYTRRQPKTPGTAEIHIFVSLHQLGSNSYKVEKIKVEVE